MSENEDNTSSYAPRSPDLSSLYLTSPTQAAPQLQQPPPASHGQAGYKFQPPSYAYALPYTPPTTSSSSSSYYHHYSSSSSGAAPPPPTADASRASYCYRRLSESYTPPVLQQPQYHHDRGRDRDARVPSHDASLPWPSAESSRGHQNQNQQQKQQQQQQQRLQSPPSSDRTVSQHSSSPPPSSASSSNKMPPRKASAPLPPAPAIEPSPVKTKFPTARIKRIMQADEEVGKVAQQTPIAVGKALELFMIQLVSKSAEVAKGKGSKRVTASMLKQVVEADEQWDFLRDIVGRVETEKEGSRSKAKAETESDEEMEEPKKRGRGGRRKKLPA